MNTNNFLPDATPDERLQALRDQADTTEEGSYYRPLSADELDGKREELAEHDIKLSELDDEKKETMAALKEQVTPHKLAHKKLLTEIKSRQEFATGTLYGLRDFQAKTITFFNEKGEFISSRRLRPDERQSKLFIPGNIQKAESKAS